MSTHNNEKRSITREFDYIIRFSVCFICVSFKAFFYYYWFSDIKLLYGKDTNIYFQSSFQRKHWNKKILDENIVSIKKIKLILHRMSHKSISKIHNKLTNCGIELLFAPYHLLKCQVYCAKRKNSFFF